MTVSASGDAPASGVTVSQPADSAAAVRLVPLGAVFGRVAVSLAAGGNGKVFTWYEKLKEAGAAAGAWARDTEAPASSSAIEAIVRQPYLIMSWISAGRGKNLRDADCWADEIPCAL